MSPRLIFSPQKSRNVEKRVELKALFESSQTRSPEQKQVEFDILGHACFATKNGSQMFQNKKTTSFWILLGGQTTVCNALCHYAATAFFGPDNCPLKLRFTCAWDIQVLVIISFIPCTSASLASLSCTISQFDVFELPFISETWFTWNPNSVKIQSAHAACQNEELNNALQRMGSGWDQLSTNLESSLPLMSRMVPLQFGTHRAGLLFNSSRNLGPGSWHWFSHQHFPNLTVDLK